MRLSLFSGFVFAALGVVAAGAFAACGSSDSQGYDDGGALDGQAGDGGPGGDAAPVCAAGSACGDGGVCAGNVCCAKEHACGDACCGSGDVCSFQRCVSPGAPCVDSTDCPAGQYCDYTLGDAGADAGARDAGIDAAACVGGAVQKSGFCLPQPPICAGDAGTPDGGALSCLEKCEVRTQGTFAPELKFAWGGQVTAPFATDVMMAPIVVELDDDNCDGKVNEQDIPEIVFTSFTGGDYAHDGTLHVISIVRGVVVEKWSKPGAVYPQAQLAGGDVDGKPGNEVVACGADGIVRAYHGDGSLAWATAAAVSCYMPSIADLDGDGKPEVIVDGAILNGADGTTKATFSAGLAGTFVVSDVDGDGKLDVVTSSQAFDATGKLFVDTAVPGSWPAIGDFDKNGVPEIVAVHTDSHTVSFWHYDATAAGKFSWIRQGVDINGTLAQHCPVGSAGYTTGGGPPTVADFDGDGVPDVALAGGIGYAVVNGAKVFDTANTPNPQTLLWTATTTDCSSAATGSSVFDFDGDGKAEVVYSDENHLRIYEGPTGKVLFEACNTTGTLIEYPLVADVDNDGHADIVVVSNSYANGTAEYQCNDGTNISQSGVRVFGDAQGKWVRTRRVWNEHAYHVTNVNEDGTIPPHEAPNWTQPGLNDFRQNKQPGSEFAAPDAVCAVSPACNGPFGLVATVTNIGEAALPAGVVVGFYAGTPGSGTKLGSAPTTLTLYSAQSENVTLPLPSPPPGVQQGTTPVYAIVDDNGPPHPSWAECRADNNTSAPVSAVCTTLR